MTEPFDSEGIVRLGWRQGAILDDEMADAAFDYAPQNITKTERDLLIVTSHDCDIANWSLDKEPVVELLRAEATKADKANKQQTWGKNPRVNGYKVCMFD